MMVAESELMAQDTRTEADLIEETRRLIEANARRIRKQGDPIKDLMVELLGERGNDSRDVQNPQVVQALRQTVGLR